MTRKQHIYKTITWRIIGTFSNMLLAYIITGSVKSGIAIGIADFIIKSFNWTRNASRLREYNWILELEKA